MKRVIGLKKIGGIPGENMNRQEMLKLLKAGYKPIDVAIWKWEDIVHFKGEDQGEDNCALCETEVSSDYGFYGTCECVCVDYSPGNINGCNNLGYLKYDETPESGETMLHSLYAIREAMREDGMY